VSPVRRTTVVLAALVAASAVATPAVAAALARAASTATASSATWGASGGPEAGPAGTGSYVVTYSGIQPIVPSYFRVYNTGSLALLGQSYLAVNSKPSGNAPPTIGLDACVGGSWNTATATCSGTVLRLTNSDATAPAAVALAIPVGGSVQVKAAGERLLNFPQAFTTTVTITVARAQAAAGTVRTS
jgi:hypothetical protein